MTLIEITLVIAILLGLIAILFLGISAYKKGSDRSKCILQMSTVEKLVISHGNMYEILPGQALLNGLLVTDGYLPIPFLYSVFLYIIILLHQPRYQRPFQPPIRLLIK